MIFATPPGHPPHFLDPKLDVFAPHSQCRIDEIALPDWDLLDGGGMISVGCFEATGIYPPGASSRRDPLISWLEVTNNL